MHIGFNFTLGSSAGMIKHFIAEGLIDYCEILIDNFMHLPPESLAETFDCPVAFHVMFSRFLESDEAFLDEMAENLRHHIDVLKPLYVSDHIARFSFEGRQLFHLAEIDYLKDYLAVQQRVLAWQERLGSRLFLENYPSIMDGGWEAPDFFSSLNRDTGAGVLFDVSNAVCAMRNCGLPLEAWGDIIDTTHHFHVGGYSQSVLAPHITLDTHDRELADDTLAVLAQYRHRLDKPGATLTYERDNALDERSIIQDLRLLRNLFPSTDGACR